jgi:hypothetical protein
MIGESGAVGLAVGYDQRKMKGRDDLYSTLFQSLIALPLAFWV